MTGGLHCRRRKDGMEVITLDVRKGNGRAGSYNRSGDVFQPVRYVLSGRKGYLKVSALENDWVVIGTDVDIDARWAPHVRNTKGPSAAALEQARERDILDTRRRILDNIRHPQSGDNRQLKQLNPSPNSIVALDQAIHMILSGS